MDGLALTDANLVLFERRVVLSDQHGGGDAVTAAAAYLRRRGKDGGKRTKRKKWKKYRGGRRRPQKRWKWTEGERMRTIEDKVMVCLCGLDNSPAGCDAITADPNLRRSRGRSGPRKRRTNNNQSVRILFQSIPTSQKQAITIVTLQTLLTFLP